MKRTTHYIFLLLIMILTVLLSGYIYLNNNYPRQEEKQNIKIDPTPRIFGTPGIKSKHRVI